MIFNRSIKAIVSFCFIAINIPAHAQYNQQILFPNDTSFQLINKLVIVYKPLNVLDYTQARIKMYREIYNENDSVSCVYTKHTLYLSPSSTDPIGYLSKNGNNNGINCEHTFPQSKGADSGNANSDMHHLFPARARVNEARSNYPFSEINDNLTDDWFYKSYSQSTKPIQMIDEYSESINGLFEPREDHKGNVARSIFYFFTMYELQADRNFYEGMKPTLCEWHLKDPVDSLEWTRTYMIAKYQDQRPNPFVLDCSLAKRSYCSNYKTCEIILNNKNLFEIYPIEFANPFRDQLKISFEFSPLQIDISIVDIFGKIVLQETVREFTKETTLQTNHLHPGVYQLILSKDHRILQQKPIVKI